MLKLLGSSWTTQFDNALAESGGYPCFNAIQRCPSSEARGLVRPFRFRIKRARSYDVRTERERKFLNIRQRCGKLRWNQKRVPKNQKFLVRPIYMLPKSKWRGNNCRAPSPLLSGCLRSAMSTQPRPSRIQTVSEGY